MNDLTDGGDGETGRPRRWLAAVAGVLVIAAALIGIALFASSRDRSRVAAPEGPGEALVNQCAEHRRPPAGFRYATEPPASGPHRPRLPAGEERRLSDDELLHALELGNVVVTYEGARPPRALETLRAEVAGPFDVELAAAGQAVLLVRHPAADGITALAWARRLRTRDAADPALRDFVEHWLGQGAARAGNACQDSG